MVWIDKVEEQVLAKDDEIHRRQPHCTKIKLVEQYVLKTTSYNEGLRHIFPHSILSIFCKKKIYIIPAAPVVSTAPEQSFFSFFFLSIRNIYFDFLFRPMPGPIGTASTRPSSTATSSYRKISTMLWHKTTADPPFHDKTYYCR